MIAKCKQNTLKSKIKVCNTGIKFNEMLANMQGYVLAEYLEWVIIMGM